MSEHSGQERQSGPVPPYGGPPPGAYGQPPGQTPPPPYGAPPGSYGQPPGAPGAPYAPGYGAPYGAPYGPPPRSTPWYKRWWVWLIVAIVIILGVIGGVLANHVSGYQLADKVREALLKQPGVTSVENVKCPSDINTDAGHDYTCSATVNGTNGNLAIHFDSDQHFLITDFTPTG